MLKIMAFLNKREDLETRAFIEHYEKSHVPLICSLAPTPIVYKRNYLVRDHELNRRQDDTIDFDVVTELVFQDRAAYLAWGAAVGTGGPGELVAADEARFLDRSRTRAYVIEPHVTSG
jgi:EthD domain